MPASSNQVASVWRRSWAPCSSTASSRRSPATGKAAHRPVSSSRWWSSTAARPVACSSPRAAVTVAGRIGRRPAAVSRAVTWSRGHCPGEAGGGSPRPPTGPGGRADAGVALGAWREAIAEPAGLIAGGSTSSTGIARPSGPGAGAARPAHQSAGRCRAGSTGDPTRTAGTSQQPPGLLRGERPTLDLTEDLQHDPGAWAGAPCRSGWRRSLPRPWRTGDPHRQRSALGQGEPGSTLLSKVGLPATHVGRGDLVDRSVREPGAHVQPSRLSAPAR